MDASRLRSACCNGRNQHAAAIGPIIMCDALSAVLRTGQCGRSPAIMPACTAALPQWAPRGRNAAQHLAGKHAHPPWLRLAPVGLVVVAIWQGAEAVPALPKSCSLFRLEELFYQILRQSRGQIIGRQPIERAAMPPGKGESAQGRTECHKSVTWHPPLGSRNSSLNLPGRARTPTCGCRHSPACRAAQRHTAAGVEVL